VATNCVSVHRIYIALEPSLDGKEPTAFKAVVLSLDIQTSTDSGSSMPLSSHSSNRNMFADAVRSLTICAISLTLSAKASLSINRQ
jgi:hypothetical protein